MSGQQLSGPYFAHSYQVTAYKMAAKIPGAKKVVIPNAGHAANIDQPEAFNRAIGDFLDALGR